MSQWFLRGRETEERAPRQLFCLPYAGSGASAFRGWAARLPGHDLFPVQLPGRENRLAETAVVDVEAITDAIARAVDRPFCLWGHSLGARLSYEVTRRLAERGLPVPERVYVSGSQPPELPNTSQLAGISTEPDDVMVERLVRLGGIAPEVVESPELLELLLPAIRADFTFIDSYRWRSGGPLPCPITAICGDHDPVALPGVGIGWSRHSAPGFELVTLPGGHFFLHECPDLVAQVLQGQVPDVDGTIDIWWGTTTELAPQLAGVGLSASEQRRADTFRFDADRERYVTRCRAVRQLLEQEGVGGVDHIPTLPGGKPVLPGGRAISWSHSRGTLVIALGNADLGVDVETLAPLLDPDEFAATALSTQERRAYAYCDPAIANDWLLRWWTGKEAVLKASGDGLRIEPSRFDLVDPETRDPWTVESAAHPHLERWRAQAFDIPGAVGCVAADVVTRLRARELGSAAERGRRIR